MNKNFQSTAKNIIISSIHSTKNLSAHKLQIAQDTVNYLNILRHLVAVNPVRNKCSVKYLDSAIIAAITPFILSYSVARTARVDEGKSAIKTGLLFELQTVFFNLTLKCRPARKVVVAKNQEKAL